MSIWSWISGDMKKEKSAEKDVTPVVVAEPQQTVAFKKYRKLLKKSREAETQLEIANETIMELLREQDAMKVLLFAIVIQHAGKLEVTSDTLKITELTQSEYDLDFRNENGNLIYMLKRKEPTA